MSHRMAFSQFVDLSSPLRPTNAERLAVLDQIASLEPRLEDIKHQKTLALAHLSSLLLEKSLLETEIMRRKELLHPIKSLPPHLLTRIFEFDVEDRPKGIARLQLVSKEWRHLVRNSPSLWTLLHVLEEIYRCVFPEKWESTVEASGLRSIGVKNGHHLVLTCMCASCAYQGIKYPSSLQSLHIHDVLWGQVGPQVALPSVEELSIEWNTSTLWNDLMKREVPWLSLFPSLRRLTLSASNTLASLDIPSAFHSIPYAASELHALKIVGPVPAYVLNNVRLPALDTLRIHENVYGEHILEKDRCIPWFEIFYEFGINVTSQVVCLGPDS
ncbi:hypothetical protein CPB86DRAFT_829951 [Serendipita vermifera]|nr:hypothetical protein CPB86DRAFT_829951 [Serendipita vermifera]